MTQLYIFLHVECLQFRQCYRSTLNILDIAEFAQLVFLVLQLGHHLLFLIAQCALVVLFVLSQNGSSSSVHQLDLGYLQAILLHWVYAGHLEAAQCVEQNLLLGVIDVG